MTRRERCWTRLFVSPTRCWKKGGNECLDGASVLESEPRSGSWGLPGMQERARKIGARLEVWSRAGVGTEVELRVPASIAYSGTNLSRWQWLRRLSTGDG